MDETLEKKKLYVTPGFLRNFTNATNNEDVSFREITQLVVLQPRFIGQMLNESNILCNRYKLFGAKPTSVHGIINVLGVSGIIEACAFAQEATGEEAKRLRAQTIDTYALAAVLSEIAERRLGRFLAPDFFLIGIIHDLVSTGLVSLEDCNKDIIRHFDGSPPRGHPTLSEAMELVAGYKSKHPIGNPSIFSVWKKACAHAGEHSNELMTKF